MHFSVQMFGQSRQGPACKPITQIARILAQGRLQTGLAIRVDPARRPLRLLDLDSVETQTVEIHKPQSDRTVIFAKDSRDPAYAPPFCGQKDGIEPISVSRSASFLEIAVEAMPFPRLQLVHEEMRDTHGEILVTSPQ